MVDVMKLRELYEKAFLAAETDRHIARVEILNALPALLDEVEAGRSVKHGTVWAGRWNVYNNGDGWTAVIPSEGYLRDSDCNVRRFPTLPAALMAIKAVKP